MSYFLHLNLIEIGRLVATRRKAAGISQSQLAHQASISRRTLIDLESGSGARDIGHRKLTRVLTVLGMSFEITDSHKLPIESELRDLFADDE